MHDYTFPYSSESSYYIDIYLYVSKWCDPPLQTTSCVVGKLLVLHKFSQNQLLNSITPNVAGAHILLVKLAT